MGTSTHTRALGIIALLYMFVGYAPTQAQEFSSIKSALWPLPRTLQEEAAILQLTEHGTFETLRVGSNGFFCLADQPDDERFSVECHPNALRAYLERRRYLSKTEPRSVRDSLLAHELKTGRLEVPIGAISRFISGKLNAETGLPDSIWVWSEISVPFAEPAITGLPTKNAGTAPWLMNAGKHGAHIMIGYALVAWHEFMTSM